MVGGNGSQIEPKPLKSGVLMDYNITCICGNKIWGKGLPASIKWYLVTCIKCGKKYRGGWWFLYIYVPIWYKKWRFRYQMKRFLAKTLKDVLRKAENP